MSEFSELVKRFDKIRCYVRDFYIYGFKTREDYSDGSGRIAVNPLFAAWKSKSFTSNDIMLHFFLTDLLSDGYFRTADETADALEEAYHVLFDVQTVRKKLAEYEALGLFCAKRDGRKLLYGRVNTDPEAALTGESFFFDMVSFYQGMAPFGFIGSTILDNWEMENNIFRFKHDFLVHTLEDEVLLQMLTAMKQHMTVRLEYKSAKSGRPAILVVTPLKILCSTQTGRRYVCIHHTRTKRLSNCRLEREGCGGTVTRVAPGRYQYEKTCFDCNELLPWIKTFIGRIVSFTCTNPAITRKLKLDLERMANLYGEETSNEI